MWWWRLGVLMILCRYSECQTRCKSGQFGPNCQFLCHCKNGEACDVDTGACASGCADHWMGPACQHRDIAYKKFSRHLDNIGQLWANRANDGNPSTCSQTNDTRGSRTEGPWWRVHFGQNQKIRGMTVTPVSSRLNDFKLGFKTTVENNKDQNDHAKPANAQSCNVHQPGVAVSSTFEIRCSETLVGNQFRIQLDSLGAQLTLCDIRIFGECGGNMQWGSSCQYRCGHCSNAALCDVITGACPHGCATGYRLSTCTDKCEFGSYGDGCNQQCSPNCNIDNSSLTWCDNVDGSCTDGCAAGWRGSYCNTECMFGYYGDDCMHKCSVNCRNDGSSTTPCDHVSGSCIDGCVSGWKGDHCNTACEFGFYGDGCKQQCNANCHRNNSRTAWCDHVEGTCEDGCVPGWTGRFCNAECVSGCYGDGCKHQCSVNCHIDVSSTTQCNHVSGSCTDGCVPGWEGDVCDTECTAGSYGDDCAMECSSNCFGGYGNCHHVTGQCTQNCTNGWIGQLCDTACGSGYYGERCRETCSENCLLDNSSSNVCNHVTGHCDSGCRAGWQRERCTEECPDGRHGFNCSEDCGKCKSDSVCDKSNGTCLLGCIQNYEGESCLTRVEANTGSPTPVGGIAGGVAAAVVVIAVVLVVLFLLRRRRRDRNSKSYPGLTKLPDTDTATPDSNGASQSHRDATYANGMEVANPTYDVAVNDVYQNEANEKRANDGTAGVYYNEPENLYYNTPGDAPIPKSGIYLSDLKDYVMTHCTSGRLENEFKSVPYGLHYPTNDALKPGNRGKNRYKDMYPYDHSRVHLNTLPGKPDSDYINASYVAGYNKENAYIAAQGPTENNVADFWRMIWEKDVNTIVMVTNPGEKGKMKCIEYWDKEAENGLFEVSVASEESFHTMIVRTIDFKLASQPGSKTVTQYHFTAWPDKSTPDGATGLVQFLHKCRQNYANQNAPVVVHCSAGVGRTGTYIGLDILYQQGKDLGYVDVLGVFKRLREQRVNMVQTKGQYAFLHEASHEAVVLPSPVPMVDFLDVYTEMLQTSQLREQFQNIADVLLSQKVCNDMNEIKEEEDDLSVANNSDNKSRNRYGDILVANEFRPFLSTQVEGCNHYINAVFVQSHRDSRGFLLSQAPLANTAVDCCRMIVERSISCVVVFDYDKLEEDEKYLPEKGSLAIGPFESQFLSSEQKSGYTIHSHQIAHKGKATDVRQFVYKGWQGGERAPSSARLGSFLGLVDDVATIQRASEGPILVHCLNGADKSGLFVVLLHVMERMRMDGDVAIPQTIRMARRRRPQIIPNYEQFKFCHDAVKYHIEDSSTYANL